MEFEALAEAFEKEQEEKIDNKVTVATEKSVVGATEMGGAIRDVQTRIVEKAVEKINDKNIIKKHSDKIAKISDKAIEVEAEKQRLIVEQVNADNKVVEQEIKNRLIVLKAEAKRLQAEQEQLNKDQKAEHKARYKAAKWELYKDKLQKMKYTYVPCKFVLCMLLFFDGVKSFFDGLGTISTAIVKALRWIIIIGIILAVLMSIPVTREWITTILKFK